MSLDRDLIAAIATPIGIGGIGIIRISGPGTKTLATQIVKRPVIHKTAVFSQFLDCNDLIDEGLALYFRAPNSFTGEDLLELHGHGGPMVMQSLLDVVCSHGARIARPGEFSERAFLNGKIDLAQAEGIADLIVSGSKKAASAAANTVAGSYSKEVKTITKKLENLRMLVEAHLDFPDEEIDALDNKTLKESLGDILETLNNFLSKANQGAILANGLKVALMGTPNVGKSSLLNVLTGQDSAIVTDLPGTTRDLLKVDIVIKGLPIKLIDTAGLRISEDKIEKIGIERALALVEEADLIIEIRDVTSINETASFLVQVPEEKKLVVYNKADLLDDHNRARICSSNILTSALEPTGITSLKDAIVAKVGYIGDDIVFTARARHVESVKSSIDLMEKAVINLADTGQLELLADNLRLAHEQLGEILGYLTPDELLGKIFSEFCIGK